MRLWLAIGVALVCGLLLGQGTDSRAPRFRAVDIYLDPQDQALAAYQLEFRVKNPGAKIVGIEGGPEPAFAEPPFYDPLAIQHQRVIIAAFNTAPAAQLPARKFRVATIHLQVPGDRALQCALEVEAAGSAAGNRIHSTATFEERKP